MKTLSFTVSRKKNMIKVKDSKNLCIMYGRVLSFLEILFSIYQVKYTSEKKSLFFKSTK